MAFRQGLWDLVPAQAPSDGSGSGLPQQPQALCSVPEPAPALAQAGSPQMCAVLMNAPFRHGDGEEEESREMRRGQGEFLFVLDLDSRVGGGQVKNSLRGE